MGTSTLPIEPPSPDAKGSSLLVAAVGLSLALLAALGLVSIQPLSLLVAGGAIAGLLVLVAVRDRFQAVMNWAVRLTIVWVPLSAGLTENITSFREPVRNMDGALTIFALGLLVLNFVKQRSITLAWTPANLPLVALLLVDVVSIVLNGVPPIVGLAGIRATLQYALLYYLLVYLNPDEKRREEYVALTFVTATVLSLLTLLELMRDVFILDVSRAPYATLGDRSALGLYLQFHITLLLALMIMRVDALRGFPRIKLWLPWLDNRVLLALFGLAVLASNGRTAWVGVVVTLIAFSLALRRWRGVVLALFLAVVMFIAFIRMSGISQYYEEHYYQLDRGNFLDRFLTLFTDRYISDSLGTGRLYYTNLSWQVITDYPVLGVGPGRWGGWVATSVFPSPLYPEYEVKVFWGQFDISFFPFWAEHGTVGLLIFLWLWVRVSTCALRLVRLRPPPSPFSRALGLGAFGMIISTLALSFIGPVLEVDSRSAFLWLMAGLATVAYRQLPSRDKALPQARVEQHSMPATAVGVGGTSPAV